MRDVEVGVAIAVMAVATYFTRIGGLWLIGLIHQLPMLARFIHHLSGSLLAALAVSVALSGDAARLSGVVAAAVVMLVTRQGLLCLVVGAAVTAVARM